MRECLLLADIVAKVENRTREKSRESRFFDVSIVAGLYSADTRARGRFCVK
jgi:hypothetical protein